MFSGYTLGAEEELQVVDAARLELSEHDYFASAEQHPEEALEIDCEIHRCALEIKTPVCPDGPTLTRHLGRLRCAAERWAQSQSQHVLAAGMHPLGDWRSQGVHRKPHYDHLVREYRDVAKSSLTFGLHIHVGLPEKDSRIPVMNLLRQDLPLLLALSASSPFTEGRDTGLHSWRTKVFGQYPRTGIPDIWADERAYVAHLDRLVRAGCLEPGFHLWEDLRLHQRYGTLEVRICDANPSLWINELLADLTQAMVATWDALVRRGRTPAPWPAALVEENKWRAGRHGLNGAFVDWDRDCEVGARETFAALLERLAPAAEALGSLERMEQGLMRIFFRGTSAERQRVKRGQEGWEGLLRDLHRETLAVDAWLDQDGVAA